MRKGDSTIWADMARRKIQFHNDKSWEELRLWGLFRFGAVSHLLQQDKLHTHMLREQKTIWVWPSPEAYHEYIEPLLGRPLDELLARAGW